MLVGERGEAEEVLKDDMARGDVALARHSPGEVLIKFLLEEASARGLLEFDFTNKRIQSAVVSPWIRLKPANTIVPASRRDIGPSVSGSNSWIQMARWPSY